MNWKTILIIILILIIVAWLFGLIGSPEYFEVRQSVDDSNCKSKERTSTKMEKSGDFETNSQFKNICNDFAGTYSEVTEKGVKYLKCDNYLKFKKMDIDVGTGTSHNVCYPSENISSIICNPDGKKIPYSGTYHSNFEVHSAECAGGLGSWIKTGKKKQDRKCQNYYPRKYNKWGYCIPTGV